MYNLYANADRKGIFLISGLVALIGGLCCLTPVMLVRHRGTMDQGR
jgi:hypothetical protein